jgi:pimeloyl-ACP methyl ester carboxylesterase
LTASPAPPDRLDEFFRDIPVCPVDGAGHFAPLEFPEFAAAIHDALVATRTAGGG